MKDDSIDLSGGFFYNLMNDRCRGFFVGVIKLFLFALSLIYYLIVSILIFFNRIFMCKLDVKVISVGNMTLGGTGKTSLVEYIARCLKGQGHKVAILTRGYKKKIPNPLPVPARPAGGRQAGKSQIPNCETMGDEPYMLSRNLGDIPVLVDADRIRAAGVAIRDYGVDTVILDDGLQQWKIKKDLEIITIDATNPLGNRHLLPRGILREPLSGLRRADVFVLTKTNLEPATQGIKDFLLKVNPQALLVESTHKPLGFYNIKELHKSFSPEFLRGKTVALFSAIGGPDSFEDLIKNLGAKVGLSFRFRDHHNYTRKDLERIAKDSKARNIDTVVTTQKDAAKVSALEIEDLGLQILSLQIELGITDEQRFRNRLLKLYSL